jgi:magnesium and cobalt transporter
MYSKNTQGRGSWISRIIQILTPDPKDKEELVDILNEASDRDLLDTDSSKMIQGVLNVTDMHVRDVMIPRSKMVVLHDKMKLQVALPIMIQSAHSRFPVIGESKDHVIGILLAKDVLQVLQKNSKQDIEIGKLARPPVLIPEGKRLDTLLKEFRTKRYHMAIVVDEYGCASGLVTIEDVLEQIVGDIEDEYDHSETSSNIRQVDLKRFQVKAQTSIHELNATLSTNFSNEEFDTVGGLVLDTLSHMPKRGETVTVGEFSVKILNAGKRRIELVEFTLNDSAT